MVWVGGGDGEGVRRVEGAQGREAACGRLGSQFAPSALTWRQGFSLLLLHLPLDSGSVPEHLFGRKSRRRKGAQGGCIGLQRLLPLSPPARARACPRPELFSTVQPLTMH